MDQRYKHKKNKTIEVPEENILQNLGVWKAFLLSRIYIPEKDYYILSPKNFFHLDAHTHSISKIKNQQCEVNICNSYHRELIFPSHIKNSQKLLRKKDQTNNTIFVQMGKGYAEATPRKGNTNGLLKEPNGAQFHFKIREVQIKTAMKCLCGKVVGKEGLH